MGNEKKLRFSNKSHCWLESSLIESEAFRNLSGKAAIVFLIRFHQKAFRKTLKKKSKVFKNYLISNNGKIIFTEAEAIELGFTSSSTYQVIIKELVTEKGFIDIAEPANWYSKQPAKFSISERWRKYGTPEYKRVEIPRRLPKGLGFQKKQKTLRQSEA